MSEEYKNFVRGGLILKKGYKQPKAEFEAKDLQEQTAPARSKTAAELAFAEAQERRLAEQIKREGGVKSHEERVAELNEKLAKLSEHHDVPKVGPG